MIKKILMSAVLACGFLLHGLASAGEVKDQLEGSIDRVIAVLEDQQLKAADRKAERRNKIFQIVEERFDFAEMSKRSLGEFWQKLTPEERQRFTDAFAKLLQNSYIAQIENYTGEKVIYNEETPKGANNFLVRTSISSRNGSIPVDYSLHQVNGQWMIYDVNIEGVSLVSNYRSQFRETVRKEGFKGLMSRIDQKLRDLGIS